MPITSFTIEGVEVDPLLASFEIRETSGGVSTLVCDIDSTGSPVSRFDLFSDVVVHEDGIRIFAGTITQTHEKGFGGPNIYDEDGAPQIVTTITAEDYCRIAERVYITETVAEGTSLKTFLTTLAADHFDDFGVTLDASQADGPNLPAMIFERSRGNEVLQALFDATGYLWRIDYDKALRMWAPGDLAAPFDIDEFDDPPKWTGDVEVERILGDDYANRVTVFSGLIEESNHTETFTGDGSTNTFALDFTLTKITDYRVYVNGVPELLDYQGVGFDLAVQWLYYASDNTIRRLTTGVADPPANGATISITFDGTFEAEATAEDAGEIAAHGRVEHVEGPRTDIRSVASAQALADQILAERLNAGSAVVTYTTRYVAPTLRAGQQQTIATTARAVSGTHLISDMRVQAETPSNATFAASGLGLIRTVSTKRHQVLEGKWEYTYRDWLGGKSSRASSAPIVTAPSTPLSAGPCPPNRSVQFNKSGAFGGDADFIYYEDENSLVCGSSSAITAADFAHCAIFGQFCEIADPS